MMSFLGHPVCHLGLNWCILLGLFIFPALAIMLVLSVFPFGKQIWLIMRSKIKYYKMLA